MANDERKVQLGVAVDATGAKTGFDQVKQEARDMAQAVGASGQQAGKGLDAVGDGGDRAAQKLDRATRSMIGSVQRATAVVQAGEKNTAKFYETLANQRGVNVEALRPYLTQLEEARRLQQAATGQLSTMGVSAAQTAAALRGIPAQFTDIATSLAAGQAPLTVFLQQGGQLKDMLGGVGPAAHALGGYVAGLINPFTLAAAGAGALAYAYVQGAGEAEEFRKQILLSGNAAGVTASQLSTMAAGIAVVSGTQGKAAEVLAQLVATGRVTKDELQNAGVAIVAMNRATGASVQDLVKDFADLGKSPADAVLKLNDKYRFLTAAVYEQVRALEEQGEKDKAAAVAQGALADTLKTRADGVKANLGLIEKAWQGVTDAAKGAWDAMVGIGRESTDEQLLKAAQERLKSMRDMRAFNESIFGSSQKSKPEQDLETYVARLQEKGMREQAAAATEAARRKVDEAGVAAVKGIDEQRKALRTSAQKMEDELREHAQRVAAIRLANPSSALLDPAKLAGDEKAIRDKYADKDALRSSKQAADEAARALQKYRDIQTDLVSGKAGLSASFNDDVQALQKGWKLSGDSVDVYVEALLALIAKQPFAMKAAKEQADAEKQWAEERKRRAQEMEQQYENEVRAAQRSAQGIIDRVQALQDEEDGLKLAGDLNISLADAIERVRVSRLLEARAAAMLNGDQEKVDAINAEIDAREKLVGLVERKASRDKSTRAFDDLLKGDIGGNMAAGFDKASQSIGTFVETFGKLVDRQEQYNLARKAQGKTSAEIAELDGRYARMQLNSYASLAGAARGFMSEKTAGYKVLLAAEQTLRAFELASSVARITGKLAEGQASALAGVANQASGDPYTSFPRMAAMAAAMAALGFAVSGGFGSSGSFAPSNTGTGTVLGDSTAKSDSIAKSIEALKEVDSLTARYSAQMLASLQSIESNIGGLAALVVQSGGMDLSAQGVSTGFKRDAIGQAFDKTYGAYASVQETMPIIGSTVAGLTRAAGNLISGLFGTKTSIQGQGVFAGAQSLESILNGGFQAQYFTDIEKKKKFLGVTTSTSRSTQYADADPLLERQITTVLDGFAKAVSAAAGPLGQSLDLVNSKIAGFVVDLGRIDLKDLSGDQIKERLTAVFGAAGDRLASFALGGFEAFQKVGEGYLQTIVRVASGLEQGQSALRRLGVAAVDVSAIVEKQGDVAAELVRQSALAVEGMSGVADVLRAVDGSANEIASAYKSLTDVRTSLKLLGLDAASVGFELIDGAGGLQDLADAVDAFTTGFLSDNDQITVKAEKLAAEFVKLGMTLPSSADAFVTLVKSIDTSTDAGKRLLGGVLSLSGGFSDLLGAIQDVGSGIADEIKRIQGLQQSASVQDLASLQASFAITTAQARAGDQSAIDKLPEISQAMLKAVEATASSSLEVAALQAQTVASLQETLAQVTDPTKRLRGFASGGDFAGGWRIVGERGPEFEWTGPSRIFDAETTARMFSGGSASDAVIEEVRALRAEFASLRSDQAAQASALLISSNRTAFVLETVNQDGSTLAVSTT